MVCVTKGDAGSSLHTQKASYRIEPKRNVKVVDTVGAGDGYTAMLAIGYLQNWHPEEILDAATEFAGRICEIKGAFPSDWQFYEDFRRRIQSKYNEKA